MPHALLTALIGPAIKLRWKLSLQVRGNGPARLVATDYYAPAQPGEPGRIRAYASFDDEKLAAEANPFPQIGDGYFAVLIDQGAGNLPYSGMTPIAGRSLADCATAYFAQSEQLPTSFALALDKKPGGWRGGGVMLQKMPGAAPSAGGAGGSGEGGLLSARDILSDVGEVEDWRRANFLLETVERAELIGPSVQPTQMLVRLFHEETPRVFDPEAVRFGCTCSAERVRESLSIYYARDIATMTTDEGSVTADCQFCGAHYEFYPGTLGSEAGEGGGGGA